MSARTRGAPRRSLLVAPGTVDRFMEKAPSTDADAFLLDLEDSVAPDEKPAARHNVVRALGDLDFGGRPVSVRVNEWGSRFCEQDVRVVLAGAGTRLDALMLPKTASPGEVAALDALISEVEREAGITPGQVGIELLVESAIGLVNVEQSCVASSRVENVAIGPGDLAATLRMPVLSGGAPSGAYPGDIYHYALFRILVAGRAAGLDVIDGPFLRVDDLDGLAESATRSRALGYDGKWAIHPTQVPVINDVYAPTADEIARAREIVRRLDEAASDERRGAVRDSGEMIDEASRKMALAVLSRAPLGEGNSEGTDRQGAQ